MIEATVSLPYQKIVRQVSESIAPAWPLDQSVAVNPWWKQRHQDIEQTFAEQAVISGETSMMKKSYFRDLWSNQIQKHHLEMALTKRQSALTVSQLLEDIERDSTISIRWKTLAMMMDEEIPSEQGHSWVQEIIQQVSQFVALYHQYPERFDSDGKNGEHLYQSWLEVVKQDKGIKTLLGVDLLTEFAALPENIADLIEHASMQWMDTWINEAGTYAFIRASLFQLSGWAGWQSWLDWQSDLNQQTSDTSHTLGLTAILLAWDTVLIKWLQSQHNDVAMSVRRQLRYQVTNINQFYQIAKQQLVPLWIWQEAMELSVQTPWVEQIKNVTATPNISRPEMQAIFCIDVRSEPMRRALEAQGEQIETLGFAGFFGIPISYKTRDGSVHRPQLPGLLAPQLVAQQTKVKPERWLRMTKLGWQHSLEKPSSNLGMVEAGGLLKLVSLFKRVVLEHGTDNPVNRDASSNQQWELKRNNNLLGADEKAELGAGILKAMGISQRLGKVVLLTGHASQTCNNHTSSSLDCGACGGQTGEINVKVLAELLNDPNVRSLMPDYGVTIPMDTHFYAAIHNTTTDDYTIFDSADEPWKKWIEQASDLARSERIAHFETQNKTTTKDIKRFFNHRANSWAQMRPEWGLCNNAGVFIAPRHLTRSLSFDGRAFLHEYHASQDSEYKQLEKIMTAPLLVMNWINLQYYASVTTPNKYGSGNKLLHNVVGGHIGVFEGNGGDLRIGLSEQSVHDGKKYRHQPVRLNAFIQAPKAAIESIMARHQDVASLINNGWVILYQIDEDNQVWQYQQNQWVQA